MKGMLHTLMVAAVIGLLTSSTSFAKANQDGTQILKAPAPVAGWESLGKCFNYPESARMDRAAGTVYVKVLVLPDGTVGKTRIQEGVRADLNMAARCCLSQVRWTPAEDADGPTAAWMVVPVKYTYRDPFCRDVSNWAESGVVKMDEQSRLETQPTGDLNESVDANAGNPDYPSAGLGNDGGGTGQKLH
jgi:TonB family protein